MTFLDSDRLSEIGAQFGVLAATFGQAPEKIRAVQIRRAERALLVLEEFARTSVPEEARKWVSAKEAFMVLSERLKQFTQLQAEINQQEAEIEHLSQTLRLWNGLQDAERQKFLMNHQRARQFTEQNLVHAESHILHKYSRYKTLNRLLPYADNAEHLCDAIFHFQNRERYEENIQRLDQRKENALERLASVKRGFNLSLLMCIFVVTIPLCAPVAFSLWNRRREIENQIANIAESKRREERRLQVADEGVIASEEIKEILGDVSLEIIRRTLEELRELRSEFQRAEKNPSVTAALVYFIDLYKPRLKELFGQIPDDLPAVFVWFKNEVDRLLNVEAERASLVAKMEESLSQMRRLLRGHNESILRDSFLRVKRIIEENFIVELEPEYKIELAKQMIRIPVLLQDARTLLSQLSYGQMVEHRSWQETYRWMLSLESNLQAMALELKLMNSEAVSY